METSLHRNDWLNHWSLVISSTSSSFTFPGGGVRVGVWEGWVGGLEAGTQRWFGQPASILMCSPKVTSLTRYLYLSHHLGNSKCFRTSVPGMGSKTKYIFLLINHNITKWEDVFFLFTKLCWVGHKVKFLCCNKYEIKMIMSCLCRMLT